MLKPFENYMLMHAFREYISTHVYKNIYRADKFSGGLILGIFYCSKNLSACFKYALLNAIVVPSL